MSICLGGSPGSDPRGKIGEHADVDLLSMTFGSCGALIPSGESGVKIDRGCGSNELVLARRPFEMHQ